MQRVGSPQAIAVRLVGEQSFTELFAPLVQPAYRLACAMLHDANAAEDAVQEASLVAWRKLGKLQDRSGLRGWYLGIVANECRNARRGTWLRRVDLGVPHTIAAATSEASAAGRLDLRKALLRLTHDDRLVVVLYFYLDMPVTEVAAVAGTSVDAARRRLYRALHKLRPGLEVEEALR